MLLENLINFETLAGGAFAERARQAVQQVMENIADPNTEWKNKRKVTIDLTFSTAEDRQVIECDVVAKTKLAPKKSIHAKFLLDKDLNGEILASEFKKQIPGQQTMKVDPSTGEILNEENAQENENYENMEGLKIVR